MSLPICLACENALKACKRELDKEEGDKKAMNKHNKAESLEPLVVLSLFAFFVWLISSNANFINEDGRYVIGIGAIAVFSAVICRCCVDWKTFE